ncbi:MAG TPA: hypothetical protein VMI54_03330 [Polyangiaceae bacterium]|nr:hypothetical protein [Polyangiaceae bacterium]
MAERSGLSRAVVAAVCLGVTAVGLANTYGDNADVVALAQRTACGSGSCSYETLRQESSPLSQSFTFQVHLTEKGRERAASTDVECRRAYVLVGEYACKVTSGGVPGADSAR